MRRYLYTMSLIVIIATQTPAQRGWVPLLKHAEAAPSITLSASTNSNVTFNVRINGLSVTDCIVGQKTYQRVSIPNSEVMTREGSPQLPVVSQLIAIPECEGVTLTVVRSNSTVLENCRVLPAPRFETRRSPDGSAAAVEAFEENAAAYASGSDFPGTCAEIVDTGHVRGQKVARVAVYPLQYNPSAKTVTAFSEFSISLSFANPSSPVNKELGLFRNIMHHAALNYELHGVGASSRQPENMLAATGGGSVTRVTDLNALVGPSALPVDYLIITHSSLFSSRSLTALADHRKDLNGYDVAIVHVDHMIPGVDGVYDFYPRDFPYQSVRDFIAAVYKNGRANHTGDGHLGYLLLAGDAFLDNSAATMVPAAYPSYYDNFEQGGDYYYACTGGDSDDDLDLMYGRLSVSNESELDANVKKIISYEANTNGSWRENYAFVGYSPSLYYLTDPAIWWLTGIIPADVPKSYAFRAHDYDARTMVTQADIPVFEQRFGRAQLDDPGNLCGTDSLDEWIYSNATTGLNNRLHTFVYEGHGGQVGLGLGNEGSGRTILKPAELGARLHNDLYTFMILNCCESGHFDSASVGCEAEALMNLQGKGAIGVLAPTRSSYGAYMGEADGRVLLAQQTHLAHVMGEAVMESKLNTIYTGLRRAYNLYGDPAVNLWPIGQTRLSGTGTFTGTVVIDSGRTVTILPGTTLEFAPDASLIVNGSLFILPGSTLRFSSNASLVVNGSLTAPGTDAQPITFDFSAPNGAARNGIRFNKGSRGTIAYWKIRNAHRGILQNGVSLDISNVEVTSCTYGICLYDAQPLIQGCTIHHNSYAGLYLMLSSPVLEQNDIRSNYYGVYCTARSNPQFGAKGARGNNTVADNSCGVYCWNNAAPVLGQQSLGIGGYNNFVNTGWNVHSMFGNVIYADNNWWGTTNAAHVRVGGVGGVVYKPFLTAGRGALEQPMNGRIVDTSIAEPRRVPMLAELEAANALYAANRLPEAAAKCLDLVTKWPDCGVSYNALHLLKGTLTVDSAKDVYRALFMSPEKKTLYAMAGLMLADMDRSSKVRVIDEVITRYWNDSVVVLALFDKFLYYYFERQDEENASAVSKQLDDVFPKSLGAVEAHRLLGQTIPISDEQNPPPGGLAPPSYPLLVSYPNPFNPSTTIRFGLPETSDMSLMIYDVLGREVTVLAKGVYEAGWYNAAWVAPTSSTGVYFVRLTARDQSGKVRFSKVRRLILTK